MPSNPDYQREYYLRNRDRLLAASARRYAENPEPARLQRKAWRDRQRARVLEAYGGVCTCCGESNFGFLSVDHVNGGGREHRKTAGGGAMLYLDIIRRGFPGDFTILCFNCNLGRAYNGGICPHCPREAEVGLSAAET